MRPGASAAEGARDPCRGLWQALTLFSPSRLQEAEKQNRCLQKELAALREELQARGPGGEGLSACLSWISPQAPALQLPRGSHTALQGSGDKSLF